MNVDTATIDDIVKRVMEQLHSSTPARSPSAPTVPAAAAVTKPTPVVDAPLSERLVLSERVITGGLLTEMLRHERTLVISPKAVLTPTAAEVIKHRQLRCVREDVSSSGKSTAAARWRILRSTTNGDVERCVREITSKSPQTGSQLVGCVDDCRKQAVSILSRAEVEGVIALVRDPWNLACRANRYSPIRAAVLTQAATLDEIRRQISPNLLCINPLGRGYFELRNLLTAAVNSGTPTAPQGWRD